MTPIPIDEPSFVWVFLLVIGLGISKHVLRTAKILMLKPESAHKHSAPQFLSCKALFKRVNGLQMVWMGAGFRWTAEHSSKLYASLYSYDTTEKAYQSSRHNIATAGALTVLQTLNRKCYDINIPLDQLKGHTLLLATTRTIKTRFLSLLAIQALYRSPKETIIVIDPKGDLEFKKLLEQQAKKLGREKDFEFFHPAFAEQSVYLNPLQNYGRATEIATRIVSLMGHAETEDAFSAFSWRAINVITGGLLYIGETPRILSIKKYIENGVGGLLKQVLEKHQNDLRKTQTVSSSIKNDGSMFDQFVFSAETEGASQTLRRMIQRYQTLTTNGGENAEVNDLLDFYRHDRNHASKMLAGLVPILSQLSSGVLGKMLSPSATIDKRKILDFSSIVEKHKIIYIGLDSMGDAVVGSAIGQILLSDLSAVAAKRYNYSQNFSRVNLFIDEAHSVCNQSLLTLANQGAGAGIELTLASQTLSDFVVALGSEEHALKLLGNLNNLICGRIIDSWTQKLVSERFGKTQTEQLVRSQSESSGSGAGLMDWGSSWSERMSMIETDTIPASVLGRIPNLEYFALLASGSLIKGKIPILCAS